MFRKVILYIAVLAVLLTGMSVPAFAAEDEYDTATVTKIMGKTNVYELKAKSSILVDGQSGQVLLESNSHEKLPIASVTKIMSMLLIMEAVDTGKIKMEDSVKVSEHAYNMGGSQVYLKPGEVFTVKEMLKAVAVHSANDATVALAEKVSGSEDAFVKAMNDRAKALGMNDTNFHDCTGLTDEGHYSSAYDIAIMSRELVAKHPGILEFTTIWLDTFRNGTFTLNNTNKLIKFYDGANGLKTGFTTKAGYCLSATAKRNNMQMIAVVLGEPDTNTRFAEARKLLDHGFANFEIAQLNKKGDPAVEVQVLKGLKTKVNSIYSEDINLTVGKGEAAKVERDIRLDENITAPVKEGQRVGEVIYKIGDKQIGKTEIVAQADVEKASFLRLFFRMILGWFSIGRG